MQNKLTDEKISALKGFILLCGQREEPQACLIAVLHKAQELFGYLNKEVMDEISVSMNIPTAHIWGVATFYHYFNLKPKGKHTISFCLGTACFVKGAERILETVKKELKIDMGGTTEDNLFTLSETRCLGACGLAPVMMIDDKVYGNLTASKAVEIIKKIRKGSHEPVPAGK